MTLTIIILLVFTIAAGAAVFFIPNLDKQKFKIVLGFSGAYLFSITVIHIMPELFHESENIKLAGIYVLIGFFLQLILEYFSSGVEHGHIHIHPHDHEGHHHLPLTMMISLCIHSFLEGSLLVHPFHMHNHEGSHTLLYGMVLHKIPEAFALSSVLLYQLKNNYKAFAFFMVYALATPLGLMATSFSHEKMMHAEQFFQFLFAVVAGNFLYISTTIFFESSPDHQLRANRLSVMVLGATMAVLAEYFLN